MSSNGAIKVNARRVVSCAAPTCSSASTAAVPPAGWMASRTAASTARSTRRPPSVRHAYHSCRNRHCPTCQGGAQAAWLAPRERDFLAVPFCHVVLTLPAALSPLALQKPRGRARCLTRAGRREVPWKVCPARGVLTLRDRQNLLSRHSEKQASNGLRCRPIWPRLIVSEGPRWPDDHDQSPLA